MVTDPDLMLSDHLSPRVSNNIDLLMIKDIMISDVIDQYYCDH